MAVDEDIVEAERSLAIAGLGDGRHEGIALVGIERLVGIDVEVGGQEARIAEHDLIVGKVDVGGLDRVGDAQVLLDEVGQVGGDELILGHGADHVDTGTHTDGFVEVGGGWYVDVLFADEG